MPATYQEDYLYLIWKNPETRKNYTVGKLTRDVEFTFQYCEEYEEAKKSGWRGLEAFPEERIYKSEFLFPVFASRLPDPKRRDIKKILEKYGLSAYDQYELLKRNGGKLPIDTYEFVWPIFPEDKAVEREFYVMGVRHVASCCGKKCPNFPYVKSGDELLLCHEANNQFDPYAILVTTKANEKLGYIPRYYNKAVLKRMSAGVSYSCIVIEMNQDSNCSECLRVRLNMPRVEH